MHTVFVHYCLCLFIFDFGHLYSYKPRTWPRSNQHSPEQLSSIPWHSSDIFRGSSKNPNGPLPWLGREPFKIMGKVPDAFPKANITPEKLKLGDYFPFGKAYFQGYVSCFGGGIYLESVSWECKMFTSCFWGCDVINPNMENGEKKRLRESISVLKKQLVGKSPLTNFTSPTEWDVHPWCTLRYLFGKKLRNIWGNEPSRQTNNDGATSNSNTNKEQQWTITPSIFQVTFEYPTLEKGTFQTSKRVTTGRTETSYNQTPISSPREIDQTPGGSKLSTLGVQHFLGGQSKSLCFTSPPCEFSIVSQHV